MNLDQLKKDIQEFQEYKDSLTRQQLKFPLDKVSLDVTHTDLLVPTGNFDTTTGFSLFSESIEVNINGKRYMLNSSPIQN